MGRANRKNAGGGPPDGSRGSLSSYDALSDGGGFTDQAIFDAEEYHNPAHWGGRSWGELSEREQGFVVRETESILRGFDGNPFPDGSTFVTGVAPGTDPSPDPRDPRVSGYRPIDKDEAYRRLEEIKETTPHRITRGLDLTDFDHVHSLVVPEHKAEQLRQYKEKVRAERQSELEKLGIKNSEAYNLERPTAREAGAQYDIHAENISLGDTLDIGAGEKARLPGGDFIVGPATVRVSQGNVSSSDSDSPGLAVEVSAPLGQGVGLLRDPLDSTTAADAPAADDARKQWISDRAACIVRDTRGKKPLSEEEALSVVERNPGNFGYDGEEDFDLWKARAARELQEETQSDRELSRSEARRVAEAEFEEIKPCHKIVYNLRPSGSVHMREPYTGGGEAAAWQGANSRLSPNPALSGPKYFERGVNPVVPPER